MPEKDYSASGGHGLGDGAQGICRKRIIFVGMKRWLYLLLAGLLCGSALRAQSPAPPQGALLAVSKQTMTLAVYDFRSRLVAVYPIACGKALGNKEKPGDMKTPEGLFSVQQIQDASAWTHDFGDGRGEIEGAYGSHFIRLKTPGHRGIGIHGTHDPASIGTRATEGCIRLRNEDLSELVKYVYVGMPVLITTSEADHAVPCRLPAAVKAAPNPADAVHR